MTCRSHKVSVTRQSQLLAIARSTTYQEPVKAPEATLAVLRRIDEITCATRSWAVA